MVLFLIKVLIFIQFSIYFDISQDVNNKVRKLIHNKENFSKLKKFTKKLILKGSIIYEFSRQDLAPSHGAFFSSKMVGNRAPMGARPPTT